MKSAASLWADLLSEDESVELEVKRGQAADNSIWETICAFSNEPGLGGGYLLLGIAIDEDPATNKR